MSKDLQNKSYIEANDVKWIRKIVWAPLLHFYCDRFEIHLEMAELDVSVIKITQDRSNGQLD